MRLAVPDEFDLCGPLPGAGMMVLEASAGTGKTYTIAALAARYVAEGLPLDQLLLITFTRMATGELRDRVRERMTRTEQELTRIQLAGVTGHEDPVVALLASGSADEVELRRERLGRAVADFDAATIATTHAFCETVLAELGTVGDLETGTAFVADVSDLIEETLDDFYVRKFVAAPEILFSRKEALTIARVAIEHPMASLEHGQARESKALTRYRLADRIRAEIDRRKRRLAVMTYDDLLTRLRDALDGPNADAARQRLRDRFRVVLVDEFQDTDPIQWQILHRAFASGAETTLVLIADPKQAIYAFRGADVYAYLNAAKTAAEHRTLRVNQRSDQPLLDAYDALFADARLGHQAIEYLRVRADDAHGSTRLIGAPSGAALRVRITPREQTATRLSYGKYAPADAARTFVAADLAADVVELLRAGARIERRDGTGAIVEARDVCPGDVAVLVRANTQAELICEHLRAVGVPAVINGAGSVFATEAAGAWLRLLDALERPSSTLRAKTVAHSAFFGWDAEMIAGAGEAEWVDIHRRLHAWSRVLRDRGVAALAETVVIAEGLPARMLALSGGERMLTDLRHIGQLLHEAAGAEGLGVTALRGWLAGRVREAATEEREEAIRRLESDEEAVQVLTIHRSKGLEFPIVYCPFLWHTFVPRNPEPVLFHDEGDKLWLDVGLEGREFERHRLRNLAEQRGEDLRLAYVALTRARHQAVIWWVGYTETDHSPLTRLVFARDDDGNVPVKAPGIPDDAAAWKRFEEIAASVGEPGRISVERGVPGMPRAYSPPLGAPAELEAASFSRRLDLRWRRTSYTDITAEAHDALIASEPEERIISDEPEQAAPALAVPDADGAMLTRPSPLGALPVGVEFGTFVHRVLEATDFAADDIDAELGRTVAAVAARGGLGQSDPGVAVQGLRAVLETPLGVLGDERPLRDVARSDRLDELEFELPLAGGDDPSGRLTLAAVAAALRAHLPDADPLRAYAHRLEDPTLRSNVRGFLTGSIDLVLRLDGSRFAIVDYKTNWLGPLDEPLTLGHYQPDALAAEMARAQYGLQALLYTAALHRYLRWRLPGYDPDRNLAGVLYLFLRGMAGADTPRVDGAPCGVFAWRPPGSLVSALSEVLDGS